LCLIYFLIFLSIGDREFFFRKEHLPKGLSSLDSHFLINCLQLKNSMRFIFVESVISQKEKIYMLGEILMLKFLGNIHQTQATEY